MIGTPPPLHLVVLAGGRGIRAGGAGDVPKQFRRTPRGPLYTVSLRTFLAAAPARDWELASVTVTAPAADHARVAGDLVTLQAEVRRGRTALPTFLAAPGDSRTASTWNALEVLREGLGPAATDLVAVHDAARPFATAALLDALAQTARAVGGAVPGVPVTDTIVERGARGTRYLERAELVGVQTPQVFGWEPFVAAHAWAAAEAKSFTDDGGLLAARGRPPAVVAGEEGNTKVTTAADWEKALARLSD